MELRYPPTIIVRHTHENPRKCSVLPLRGRPDVLFFTHPVKERPPLDDYVRLAAEGPPLLPADAEKGILLLDGSWRWAESMTRAFLDVPARSLHGWRTAYPRVSKRGTDPDNGLASIEALFVAYHLLGRPTQGLLDHYYWAAEFLRANGFDKISEELPGTTSHSEREPQISGSRFPVCLRVMAEYGSSGIWVAELRGPFRHAMVKYRKLGLPAELAARFAAWIEAYWARAERRPLDVAAFNDEGRSLAAALKQFVGPDTKVIFEPELEDGGLGQPEIIELAEPAPPALRPRE